jgi:type I restriction enzyme S subunit
MRWAPIGFLASLSIRSALRPAGRQSKLRPCCLPPASEQREIVLRVDELFSLADDVKRRVFDAALRADKLTQSILTEAFHGELVPSKLNLPGVKVGL